MDKSNQEITTRSMDTVRLIEEEKKFTRFASLSDEVKLLIWKFAVNAIPPRVIEFEANLPKSDGRHIGTQIRTGRATKIYRYGDDEFPIIDYHGRLTFRCAFSTEFQHANGSPPALLHTTRSSREIALKSYQSCFSSFLERPIYYNYEKDLVYIDRLNNAKRDITYRKNPFERASEEDKRRITRLAFNYDNLHMDSNPWLESFTRYLVQHLGNVHVITFLLRKLAIKNLQDNKAHKDGTFILDRKLWDRGSNDGTEIYRNFDTDEEAEKEEEVKKNEEEEEEEEEEEKVFDAFSDIDDDTKGSGYFDSLGGHVDDDITVADDGNDSDDEIPSYDSENDFENFCLHTAALHRNYDGLEETSEQLQRDWKLARWEWWEPVWEEFFDERDEHPTFDDVTFPEEELLDNPDWTVPRVQLVSFEEMGCPISDYNKHCFYPEEEFVCACESDDDFELLGSSDWEGYNSTAEDDL
ncbi:uncharacterized protein Bfra_006974 [Botrytis fragariae]|uniref:2EXR domain-containing protein n=1 Tax=Botrytis fragariae TaxID=1964551 RepID=A0A8H6AHG8_9HELO|nr:uncharacterized protein Bfra_006974 [Botrytis fragariae]KAF5867776.1 hypothetical protein Bfra_006974 [Botrytis fragariae]